MIKHDKSYKKHVYDALNNICKGSGILLIGLTGGIATGKSTVCEMFRELGSVIIDFDLLARSVVEPGKKSWKLITDYFGNHILNPDNSINREELSSIVFSDPLEREKLESFTHPYIWDEFLQQAEKAIQEDSNVIIQAAIPLLIEGNMQDLFSKIIVVYTPPELQIKRIMQRDNISGEKAKDILAAQMPIDDKIPYGDFIIKNDSHPDKTREQVKALWEILIKVQQENQPGS